jgi:hypothetical protein
MSIKSLLQLILTLLILLILGGIYYIYFYSNPVKNQINLINQTNNLNKENKTDQEMLDEIPRSENDNKITQNNIEIVNKTNDHIKTESKETKNNNLNNTDTKKLENLTKEIEYVTSNKEGDIFKILAKFGKSNIKNSDILDLEYVDGLISSKKRSQIFISSNFAKYNYNNRNSQFYDNVQIKYDNKLITCDNLDLKINENYAVAYNNVIIKDNKSIMKAQMVTLNIITKDIKINSQNKVEIITN